MNIEVVKGDITGLNVEAIVNPANSRLTMGGGLAKIIKDKGGTIIEKEAREKGPISVGRAIITTAGDLPAEYVIHAPTMKKPIQRISSENAAKAMKAVLQCAKENKISEVGVPGLGTGVGGISHQRASEKMMDAIKNFENSFPKKVILVGFEKSLFRAFKEQKEARF